MKTAVTVAPGRIEVVERPEPTPGAGEALVRVERVGVCGSDLHAYHGTHPYARYPLVQGHEVAGRIAAIGGEYDGPLRVGDRVAVEPLLPCGTCYPCRQGRPNACVNLAVLGAHVDGALREWIAMPTRTLFAAGDLDAELTALVEPVSIGVQAASRGAIGPDDQVVVFGAGPIGQAVLLAAVDRGARVLVTDRLPSRLALARRLGAEATVEVGTEDLKGIVAAWTGGDGPGVVVDAVGAPEVIRAAIDLVASTGRVVIVGLSDREVSIPVVEFTRKELTIVGSRNNAGQFAKAVDLVRRRRDVVGALVTHRFPLARAAEAVAFADEHPAEAEKVMIEVAE